jgi:hypothetical protein
VFGVSAGYKKYFHSYFLSTQGFLAGAP